MVMKLDEPSLSLLHAVFAMGVLTLIMMLWMSIARLRAMLQVGVKLQETAHTADLRARLPSWAMRVSDNYNHLFEAPVAFYAVAFAIVLAGIADPAYVTCAWVFVAGRVMHSLVQATINVVPLRMVGYWVSWTALGIMIVRGALAV
jgi:hypothetical protein